MFTTIETETKDGVITIWLNRPEVHNAFNKVMLEELAEVFLDVRSMDAVCVILRGRGKAEMKMRNSLSGSSVEIEQKRLRTGTTKGHQLL